MAAKNTFFELEEVNVDGLVSTPAMFEEEEWDFSLLNEETTPLPTPPKRVSKFAQMAKSKIHSTVQNIKQSKKVLAKELMHLTVKNEELVSQNQETQGDNEDLNLLVDNHRKVIQVLGDDMDRYETEIFTMEEVIKTQKECFEAEIRSLEQDKKLQKDKYEMEISWLKEDLDECRKKNIQLRLKMHNRQDTEQSCARNQSEMSEVETYKKTIQDLEEQLRLKTAESDLLRSTNQDLSATNVLLKTEAETCKKTLQDLEEKHRIETEERDAKIDLLKSTNQELTEAKAHLQNEIDSLGKTLETQKDIQDQNKTLKIQKEEADSEILRLKSENEDLEKKKSVFEKEMLEMFEEMEDKLAAEFTTNLDKTEEISKLKNKISNLEKNKSVFEKEMLEMFKEMEDKLAAEFTTNLDKAEEISKLKIKISNLENELRIHNEKYKTYEEVENKLATQIQINCDHVEQTQTSLESEIRFLNKTVERHQNTIEDLKDKMNTQKEQDTAKILKLKRAHDELQDNLLNF
ncbi:hypothetical protein WMY93_016151 [Mugilogobius chulae]|uniref:Synaptonemal complex protein 1 n=1 Tax=Mugilogobius chulae TaxID=88201 RepID=A0AAW0NWT1_9GOBI